MGLIMLKTRTIYLEFEVSSPILQVYWNFLLSHPTNTTSKFKFMIHLFVIWYVLWYIWKFEHPFISIWIKQLFNKWNHKWIRQKSVYFVFRSFKLCKIVGKCIIQLIIEQIKQIIVLGTQVMILDVWYKFPNKKPVFNKPKLC